MGKLISSLVKLVAMAALVLIVVVVALLLVVDVDQYTSALEELALESTGLQLEVAGDVELVLRPSVALNFTDLRLRSPGTPRELASLALLSLRIDPMELLGGRLAIRELRATDLHANWYTDADGNNAWLTSSILDLLNRQEQDFDEVAGQVEDQADNWLLPGIGQIVIDSANIDIQNLRNRYYYTLRDLNLTARNSNGQNQPFPVQGNLQFVDHSAPEPWPISFSSTSNIDVASGRATLDDLQLTLSPARVEGEIAIDSIGDNYSWTASLTSNDFDLTYLTSNLSGNPPTGNTALVPGTNTIATPFRTEFQLTLSGNQSGIEVQKLDVGLGDMQYQTEASIQYASQYLPANISFELKTNNLDLNPYLAHNNATTVDAAEPNNLFDSTPVPDALQNFLDYTLPDRFFSGTNIQGNVWISSLEFNNTHLGEISIFTNLENGVLDIEVQPVTLLEGSVQGSLQFNNTDPGGEVRSRFEFDNVNVTALELPLLLPDALQGNLSLESSYLARGNSPRQWLNSITGSTVFDVRSSAVDIGVIKQVFTAISALSPSGAEIQQWPEVVRFAELKGFLILDNGISADQHLKVRLDNLDLTGTGGIDLEAGRFDYDFFFTVLGNPALQSITIDNLYHDVSWPVDCSAAFSDPFSQYCSPIFAQVREIFSELGRGPALTDPPLEDQQQEPETEDPVGGFLRGLFGN